MVGVAPGGDIEMADADGDDSRIVLHEDKKYYPTAIEVYGEGVRAPPANRLPRAEPQPSPAEPSLTGGALVLGALRWRRRFRRRTRSPSRSRSWLR